MRCVRRAVFPNQRPCFRFVRHRNEDIAVSHLNPSLSRTQIRHCDVDLVVAARLGELNQQTVERLVDPQHGHRPFFFADNDHQIASDLALARTVIGSRDINTELHRIRNLQGITHLFFLVFLVIGHGHNHFVDHQLILILDPGDEELMHPPF